MSENHKKAAGNWGTGTKYNPARLWFLKPREDILQKLLILTCVSMLSVATFTSQRASAANADHVRSSNSTDFSSRKKMKRMKKGMMKGGSMEKSKMGGEPPSGSAGGGMMKKGM